MGEKRPGPKRVKTGIAGLDELLNGGLPEKKIYVITGGCGTGKTIFGLEFIYNGAAKFKEPGVLVNLEEDKPKMLSNIKSFGWDLEKLERENLVRVIPYIRAVSSDIENALSAYTSSTSQAQKSVHFLSTNTLIELIKEAVNEIGARRLVIDPLTAISLMADSESLARMGAMTFFKHIAKLGVTALVTVEAETGYWQQLKFIADGVIQLDYVHSEGKAYRGLSIQKIRGSAFTEGYYNFTITNKGIDVQAQSLFDKQ